MATKIGVINAALTELGHRTLSDTGEPVEAGRVMTGRYDRVVADCLKDASWNFAMETIKADADTGVTPAFGYTEVFAKPSDWVRTIALSADEYFSIPLTRYDDDAGFWSADVTPVYVRYVSDDTGLGLELTRWPSAFERYVELELAVRCSKKLTQDTSLRDELKKDRNTARLNAKNIDAMNEAQPKFAPMGSWNSARGGFGHSRRDRGSRGSLTG